MRRLVKNGAAAIGNFDGVHRGHAAVIARLAEEARRVGGPALPITFDPHPVAVLAPERLQPLLTTPKDRIELLRRAGASNVFVIQTTREWLSASPREFLDLLLGTMLEVRAVVEGFNFQFGRNRAGTNETIARWCEEREIAFTEVPPFELDGMTVSSSRVRAALVKGDAAAAIYLLGRPYRLRGTVGQGAQRGQALGFPTANLDKPLTLVPGDGVYACTATLADGATWPAAVNIGPNPTFGEHTRKVEAHLIGFSGNLYGQEMALDFAARLRETRTFEDVGELKAQLEADVHLAASLATRERVASDVAK